VSIYHIVLFGSALLVLLQASKLTGTLSSLWWLLRHGRDFAALLNAHEETMSDQLYWELLDQTAGRNVFPLGVLEYRVDRYASLRRPPIGRIIRLARVLFYDFTSFGVMSVVLLYVVSAPVSAGYFGSAVVPLAATSAVLIVLELAGIYAEACFSYATVGSYGLAYHGGSQYVRARSTVGMYLIELRTLAGATIYSLGTGTFIFYFTATHGGEFAAFTVARRTFLGSLEDLLTCGYYAIATFFTADSPEPQNGTARAATVALIAQAVSALILAFSTFTLYVSGREQPEPTDSEPKPQTDTLTMSELVAPRSHSHRYRRIGYVLGGLAIGAVIARRRMRRER